MIINATKGKDLNIQNGTGEGSIVEGSPVDGTYSLPEATGINSHSEGLWSDATGDYSHAEGRGTTASGWAAHAEGYSVTSSGQASHAEGYFTIANHAYQHVFGTFNIGDPSTAANTEKGNYIEIVGNGNSTSQVNRSNARTLDWEGNEVLSGFLSTKSTVIDASKANNNVSSALYPSTFDIRDSADRIISRQEAVVHPDGRIGGNWYVRNFDTSGNQVARKGILMWLNKNGTMTYEISDPANFCSAIGAIGASGGTITGQITKAGVSCGWAWGRDHALLRMTSISGYSPCISTKTTNGTWEMGTYDYSTHTDRLIFTYITDSNYNNNNNSVTGQVQFLGGGHVVANNYYGNGNTLSNIVLPNTAPNFKSIELIPDSGGGYGGYIDFHYNGSTSDFTSRIIENGNGILDINGVKFSSSGIVSTFYARQLWSGSAGTSSYSLNESIANYRLLSIRCYNTSGTSSSRRNEFILSPDFIWNNYNIEIGLTTASRYRFLKFTSATSFTTATGSSQSDLIIYQIVGLR